MKLALVYEIRSRVSHNAALVNTVYSRQNPTQLSRLVLSSCESRSPVRCPGCLLQWKHVVRLPKNALTQPGPRASRGGTHLRYYVGQSIARIIAVPPDRRNKPGWYMITI